MDSEEYKMSSNEWQMFNHQKKSDKFYEKNRYYCLCGHSVVIFPKEIRVFCTYCGHWVYKDKRKQRKNVERIKQEDFRHKVKKNIKKVELRDNFKSKLKETMNNGRKKNFI